MKNQLFLFLFALAACSQENKPSKVVQDSLKTQTLAKEPQTFQVENSKQKEKILKPKRSKEAGIKQANLQTFWVNPQTDTILQLKMGTRIGIPSHAFEGCDNTSSIEFSAREFYTLEDLMAQQLGTVSGTHLLETSGSLWMDAHQNGKILKLKPGKTIQLAFVKQGEEKAMEIFYGDKKGSVFNWVPEPELKPKKAAFAFAPEESETVKIAPRPKPQKDKILEYLHFNMACPPDLRMFTWKGSLIVNITTGSNGKIKSLCFEQFMDQKMDKALSLALEKIPFPLVQPIGEASFTLEVPIHFKSENGFDFDREKAFQYQKEINKQKVEECEQFESGNLVSISNFSQQFKNKTLASISNGEIGFYFLQSTRLGFANCDFLRKDTLSNFELVVEGRDAKKGAQYGLVFKNYRTVVFPYLENNKLIFKYLPKGSEATLIVLRKNGYYLFCNDKEVKIEKNSVEKLEGIMVNEKAFRSWMNRLNAEFGAI